MSGIDLVHRGRETVPPGGPVSQDCSEIVGAGGGAEDLFEWFPWERATAYA